MTYFSLFTVYGKVNVTFMDELMSSADQFQVVYVNKLQRKTERIRLIVLYQQEGLSIEAQPPAFRKWTILKMSGVGQGWAGVGSNVGRRPGPGGGALWRQREARAGAGV